MPFIDDELLWCPDNDGKMVDLTECLQVSRAECKRFLRESLENPENPVFPALF